MEKENTITAVLVEPGEPARIVEIGNDLNSLREAVKGDVEIEYPFAYPALLIFNKHGQGIDQQGKVVKLPPNRNFYEYGASGFLHGPFLIAAGDNIPGNGLKSLTPDLAQKYAELFKEPERFIQKELTDEEIDREAERAIDEYEAEFGADGYRAFRENEAEPEIDAWEAEFGDAVFRAFQDDAAEINARRHEYMLLSRLKVDCEYYLDAGGRSEKHLWAGNVTDQIAKMRELYDLLPEKPVWLTKEDIDSYEQRMIGQHALRFNEVEFEKLIPHGMRLKVNNVVNGNEMYWVTQEVFTVADLRKFQQAVREYDGDIKKFYVTPRDLSYFYDFEYDSAKKVFAIVTPDNIFIDDYVRAMREEGIKISVYGSSEQPIEKPTTDAQNAAQEMSKPKGVKKTNIPGPEISSPAPAQKTINTKGIKL